MKITEHIDALRHEGTLLAEAAARTDLSAPVPTCPEWQLGDLLRHVGHVHRWATAIPSRRLSAPLDEAGVEAAVGPMPSDAALVDWFREGHATLVDALVKAPADVECWTFMPAPSPLAFWARRQAHETAIHRHDADAAAGVPGPAVGTALALDGIDELVRGFMTRSRATLHSDRPRTLQVRATDGHGTWRLTITQEPPAVTTDESSEPADLTLTGPARELYLLLWNRLPAEQARQVEPTGDRDLLDLWRNAAAIG
ncbi:MULTISPECIES: maleylpyruvate isomerase family mycothiol-dependent enzyme [unclassified Kitasatospora]|uniref:maleylpyruvate isomerase family mycothiol-dependent enzyme n=1 Tax=unclassified Kitasatospora TaxID=2633591 RepID=UPI0033CF737C